MSRSSVSALLAATREEVKSHDAASSRRSSAGGSAAAPSATPASVPALLLPTHTGAHSSVRGHSAAASLTVRSSAPPVPVAPPRGAATARAAGSSNRPTTLVSNLTKGQRNRTFFVDAPLFSMDPVDGEPLFFRTGGQAAITAADLKELGRSFSGLTTSLASLSKSAATRSRRALHAGHRSSRAALTSLQQRDDEDDEAFLYSPDMPALVPFGKKAAAREAARTITGPSGQTSTASIAYHQASQARLAQTAPSGSDSQAQLYVPGLPGAPYLAAASTSGGVSPRKSAGGFSASHARLTRTYVAAGGPHAQQQQQQQQHQQQQLQQQQWLQQQQQLAQSASQAALLASLQQAAVLQSSMQAASSSQRLELLDFLQSPRCNLFVEQLQVRGSELDALIGLAGGSVPVCIAVLEVLEQQQPEHRYDSFTQLVQTVREQQQHLMALAAQRHPLMQAQAPEESKSNNPQLHSSNSMAAFGGITYMPLNPGMTPPVPMPPMTAVPPHSQQHAGAGRQGGGRKAARARAAATAVTAANGGAESLEPLPGSPAHLARVEELKRVVVEFLASPACVLFPDPSAASSDSASGVFDGSAPTADIQINARDLDALVSGECGTPELLIGYLNALNQQLSEVQHGSTAKTDGSGSTANLGVRITEPFTDFAALLACVHALHVRTVQAKLAVRSFLNNRKQCHLFAPSAQAALAAVLPTPPSTGSRLYKKPGSPSRGTRGDVSSAAASEKDKASATPPRFTLVDMDRLWIEGGAGEDTLTRLQEMDAQGVRVQRPPFLAQIAELVAQAQQQFIAKQQQQAQLAKEAAQPSGLRSHKASSSIASLAGSTGGVSSPRLTSTNSPALSSISAIALPPPLPSDPAALFARLSARAQRFVVELMAFFRSPKTHLFSEALVPGPQGTAQAAAQAHAQRAREAAAAAHAAASWERGTPLPSAYGAALASHESPSVRALTISQQVTDSIGTEELVALMRAAGERVLLQEEEQAADRSAVVSSEGASLSQAAGAGAGELSELDALSGAGMASSSRSSSSAAAAAAAASSSTNRALFFLSALHAELNAPKQLGQTAESDLKPFASWTALLQAVRQAHEQSLLVQARLLDRLTNPSCTLFGTRQVRRVPDSFGSVPKSPAPASAAGAQERKQMSRAASLAKVNTEEDVAAPQQPATLQVSFDPTRSNAHQPRSPAQRGGRPSLDSTELPVDSPAFNARHVHAHNPSMPSMSVSSVNGTGISTERSALYLGVPEMVRLYFDSTAGSSVGVHLDAFEAAGRTFADLTALTTAVKIAHIYALAQLKHDAAEQAQQSADEQQAREKREAQQASAMQRQDAAYSYAWNRNKTANRPIASSASSASLGGVTRVGPFGSGFYSSSSSAALLPAAPGHVCEHAVADAQAHAQEAERELLALRASLAAEKTRNMELSAALVAANTAAKRAADAAAEAKRNEARKSSGSAPVIKLTKSLSVACATPVEDIPLPTASSVADVADYLRLPEVQARLFEEAQLPVHIDDEVMALIMDAVQDAQAQGSESGSDSSKGSPPSAEEEDAAAAAEALKAAEASRDPVAMATAAAASVLAAQAVQKRKCNLVLQFVRAFEISATRTAPESVATTTSAPLAPALRLHARTASISAAMSDAASRLATSVSVQGSGLGGGARVELPSGGHPSLDSRFTSVESLCDALYVEYALHCSKDDTLAFLRSTHSRLLPEGNAATASPTAAPVPSSSRASAVGLVTGGPHGSICAAHVDALYASAKAGLYTLAVLHELNQEHVRAVDLDGLVSLVAGYHATHAGRVRSHKLLIFTHLSGSKCRLFPTRVRVTDAHLDLLLTTTRNSGSAALHYLHHLSLTGRTFSSMAEVVAAVRQLTVNPVPFKSALKAKLSDPMCVVMNKAPPTPSLAAVGLAALPSDSIVDRLWEVQGAQVDALAHILALHADAQGFASWPELITTIGANQASVRASQAESDKFALLTHLVSSLCTLWSFPLYDVTITPRQLEALLAAGGGAASVVLFHLEMLDTPREAGGHGESRTFQGMAPLIARVAALHAEVRGEDERLQSFLNSRQCVLFRHAQAGPPSAALSFPLDDASIERLLSLAGTPSVLALSIARHFNAEQPQPRSFGTLDEFARELRTYSIAHPEGPPPPQPPQSASMVSLEPIAVVPPPSDSSGLGVNAPNYADGSMALDAEEGVAGKFVIDPTTLYDGDEAAGPGTSPQLRPRTLSDAEPSMRPSSAKFSRSRPTSATQAAAGGAAAAPLDPFERAQLEQARESIVHYLNTRCNLFSNVEGALEISEDDIDACIRFAQGNAANAVLELARMDALGTQFQTVEEMISALRQACQATHTLEEQLKDYHNPDEDSQRAAAESGTLTVEENGVAPNESAQVPQSVRDAEAASEGVFVMQNAGVEADASSPDSSASPQPGLHGSASSIQHAVSHALDVARAIERGVVPMPVVDDPSNPSVGEASKHLVRPEHIFSEQDRQALRQAIAGSQVIAPAVAVDAVEARQEEQKENGTVPFPEDSVSQLGSVELNQLLILCGGLEPAQLHLQRFHQAGRHVACWDELPLAVESAKVSGIYHSADALAALVSFLSSPDVADVLKAPLVGTELLVPFGQLPPAELDTWARACGGAKELQHYLTTLARRNQSILAAYHAAADPPLDEHGARREPALIVPRSAADLIAIVKEQEREERAKDRRLKQQARRAQAQAMRAFTSFFESEHCTLFSAAARRVNGVFSGEEVSTLLRVLCHLPTPVVPSDADSEHPSSTSDDEVLARWVPSEEDVQQAVELLQGFDAVGRKFKSMRALTDASRALRASSASEAGTSPAEVASESENLPGVHMSRAQKGVLLNFLSSNATGLLPLDAPAILAATDDRTLEQLVIECTWTARHQGLQPLHTGNSRTAWPRYIAPLQRLQQRSPTGGAEYATLESVIQAVTSLRSEPGWPSAEVHSCLSWLTTEPASVSHSGNSSLVLGPGEDACALFSELRADAGLEIDHHDVEDLLQLVDGWSALHALLLKLSRVGAKVSSLPALIHKVQRVLAFGFFGAQKDRDQLEAFLRDPARNNNLLEVAADTRWSEAQMDALLEHSRGQGAPFLLHRIFPLLLALAAAGAAGAAKCRTIEELAQRVRDAEATLEMQEATASRTGSIATVPGTGTVTGSAGPPLAQRAHSLVRPSTAEREEARTEAVASWMATQSISGDGGEINSLWDPASLPVVLSAPDVEALLQAAEGVDEKGADGTILPPFELPASASAEDRQHVTVWVLRRLLQLGYLFDTVAQVVQVIRKARSQDGNFQHAEVHAELTTLRKEHAERMRVSIADEDRARLRAVLLGSDASKAAPFHLLSPEVVPTINDSVFASWLAACGDNVALLSERLGLFKTVQRHFTSVEEVLPALRELARTGLAISAPRKAELISYLLAEHTHLFDEPLAGGSNAANGGAADAYKAQIVHSAAGSELTQLFVVGEGYSNLLWRLQYLDAVGRRFRSVADLRSALASLRGSTPPTDEERELVLAFLASGECTLFQLLDAAAASTAAAPDSSHGSSAQARPRSAAKELAELEIDAAHLDAAILCRGGVDGCLRGMRALQREQIKVRSMHELVPLLYAWHSRPSTPAQSGAEQQQLSSAAHPAAGPTSAAASASGAVPLPSSTLLVGSAAHDLLLDYLSLPSTVLFSLLGDSELEIGEDELDAMVASTAGDVHTTIAIMKRINEQQRGFITLAALAKAVEEEYNAVRNHALAAI